MWVEFYRWSCSLRDTKFHAKGIRRHRFREKDPFELENGFKNKVTLHKIPVKNQVVSNQTYWTQIVEVKILTFSIVDNNIWILVHHLYYHWKIKAASTTYISITDWDSTKPNFATQSCLSSELSPRKSVFSRLISDDSFVRSTRSIGWSLNEVMKCFIFVGLLASYKFSLLSIAIFLEISFRFLCLLSAPEVFISLLTDCEPTQRSSHYLWLEKYYFIQWKLLLWAELVTILI